MTTDVAVPNHHHDHPAFAGMTGLLAAATMTVGRDGDARLAAELAQLAPGDLVVDIGCGPGVAARHAARHRAAVTGVDPAPVMLRVARALTRRVSVRYVEGAAESLPLPDGCATVVWSIATVHHWRDIDAGLREVRRILRPGGRFVVLERLVRAGATGLAGHGWTIAHAAEFARACRNVGFAEVEVEGPRQAGRRTLVAVTAIPLRTRCP
jgi:ubiquinone/menaquinone biosynthesis C-methylase UbiE